MQLSVLLWIVPVVIVVAAAARLKWRACSSAVRPFITALLAACLLALGLSVAAAGSPNTHAAAVTHPPGIKAAFYYPWFPETWHSTDHAHPALGHYDSGSQTLMAAHVAMAQYAGLDAFISSWWGQGTHTDQRLPMLLDAAAAKGFHIAPYYEQAQNTPTTSRITSDLNYLLPMTANAGWLKVNAKPVLFLYNAAASTSCADVARYVNAAAGRWYINAKVFNGYQACSTQPDSWHQYGPATSTQVHLPYSYAVSPGYDQYRERAPRLTRDLTQFKSDLTAQLASGAQWDLVTTFNEWGEGTAVEPATEWKSSSGFGTYLDAMRIAYVGGGTPTSSTPAPTSTAPTSASRTSTRSASPSTSATRTSTRSASPSTSASRTSTSASRTSTRSASPTPTVSTSGPPPGTGITKVLTVIEENHSLNEMKSGMPYLFSLAQGFAYASNYKAIRHPSLPNYLAIAGGSTFGVTDDAAPSSHPVAGPSVFGQAMSVGKSARSYLESMSTSCKLTSTSPYAVKHNPWAYFSDERAQCAANNRAMGTPSSGALHSDIAAGTLPNAGMVVANLNNDAHDGTLATADNWLKGWLPQIMAGRDYTSGHLVIVITADEDDTSQSNLVLTTVVSPALKGLHKVVNTALTHYSLTGFYDQVDGTAMLRGAATAPNFATAFGLRTTP